jgi:hypothetical protein
MSHRRTIAWLMLLLALSGHFSATLLDAERAASARVDPGSNSSPAGSSDLAQIQSVGSSALASGLQPTGVAASSGKICSAVRWHRAKHYGPSRILAVGRTLRSQSVLLQI